MFQAAFVVLLRRADRVRAMTTFGPWLYRVAALTARNLRRKNAVRLGRRAALTADHPAPADPPAVDDMLLSLPAADRAAVVLVYLLGHTRAEAAALLRVPEGTLNARVSRAVAKLRGRFAAPAALLVPAALVEATVASAAVGRVADFLPVSPTVVLAEGVLRMAWLKPTCAAGLAAAALLATGVGVRSQAPPIPPAKPAPAVSEADARTAEAVRKEMKGLDARRAELRDELTSLDQREAALRKQLLALETVRPSGPYFLFSVTKDDFFPFTLTEFEAGGEPAFCVHGGGGDPTPVRKFLQRAMNDPLYRVGTLVLRLESDGPSEERVRKAFDVVKVVRIPRVVIEIAGDGRGFRDRVKKVPVEDAAKFDVAQLCRDAAAFRAAK